MYVSDFILKFPQFIIMTMHVSHAVRLSTRL